MDELPATGALVPEVDGWGAEEMIAFAADAESAGVDSIWCWDGWGYEPFALLARIAEHTDCPLGTGIANAFARSPATVAMDALTLDDATDGRFVLGVGTSTPPMVESLHGEPFERPLRRVRETIEVVRLALSGEPIEYDGAVFELSGFTLEHAGDADVPVLNAALGPTNMAMTCEYADGVLTNLLPFGAIDDAVAEGARRAGVDPDLHVGAMVPLAVSDDRERARSLVARHVAYYVGATDPYHDAVARHGFADVAAEIEGYWEAGDYEAANGAVTDDLIDAVAVAGRPGEARDRVEDLRSTLDAAVFEFVDGSDEAMVEAGVDAVAR